MLKKAINDGTKQSNAASLNSAVVVGGTQWVCPVLHDALTAPRALVESSGTSLAAVLSEFELQVALTSRVAC